MTRPPSVLHRARERVGDGALVEAGRPLRRRSRRRTAASSGSRHVEPTGGGAPFGRKSAADAGNFARRVLARCSIVSRTPRRRRSRGRRARSRARGARPTSCFFEPSVCHASQRPATLPGTPTERQPVARVRASACRRGRGTCRASRPPGAVSRKSRAYDLPPMRATRKPPPPMLPAVGNATASANAVATAASTALPPAGEDVRRRPSSRGPRPSTTMPRRRARGGRALRVRPVGGEARARCPRRRRLTQCSSGAGGASDGAGDAGATPAWARRASRLRRSRS